MPSGRTTSLCSQNLDQLFEQFLKEKEKVLATLESDPVSIGKKLWVFYSRDCDCQCQLGQQDYYATVRCKACDFMERLTALEPEIIAGRPFRLQCGRQEGSILSLERVFKVIPSFRKDGFYLHFDPFSLDVLINTYMEKQISQHVLRHYTHFICGDQGYHLTENYYNLSQIDWDEMRVTSLFSQLYELCNELVSLQLVLGKSAHPDNLVLGQDLSLKIKSFSHSYLKLKNYIFAPESYIPFETSFTPFFPLMIKPKETTDFYLFLVGIVMGSKTIYDLVINTPSLHQWWCEWWDPKDLLKLDSRIVNYHITHHNKVKIEQQEIESCLKGLTLRSKLK
jgi:hypothetical protein